MLLETSKKLLRLLLLQLHFDIVVELAHIPRLRILVVAEALKEGPAGRLSRPFMLADADARGRGSHRRRGGSGAHPAAAGPGVPRPLSRQLILRTRVGHRCGGACRRRDEVVELA